jgi:aspartokinase
VAVSRALRRLLRVRGLEEEQSRLALEASLAELRRMEHALEAAAERDRRGRALVGASARTAEVADRLAGLAESKSAARRAAALAPRIAAGETEVADLRDEFLTRRVERRQADTLIEEAEALEALEAARRGQQALDDWHAARRFREAAADPHPDASGPAGTPKS